MPQDITYTGSADGWTVAEFKTLTDALAVWHDPNTGRLGRKLYWDVSSDTVYVTLIRESVAQSDISAAISDLSIALSNAPNTWDTSDQQFSWG